MHYYLLGFETVIIFLVYVLILSTTMYDCYSERRLIERLEISAIALLIVGIIAAVAYARYGDKIPIV